MFEIRLAVGGDVPVPGVKRPVGGDVGHVEEEGLGVAGGLFNKPDGVIAEGLGHEEAFFGERPSVGVEIEGVLLDFVEVADLGAAHGAEGAVKAPLEGRVAPLPLADHHRPVAGRLEQLGDRRAPAEVFGLVPAIAAVPDLLAVETGEERCPGGAADGVVVELGEAEAVGGERVDMGGADFAAVAADIGPAHVVGHDQHDVGPLGGEGSGRGEGECGAQEQCDSGHAGEISGGG